jgi:hypothetical protein
MKSEVIVTLMGGLGNQMFQYAFGHELARLADANLVLDKSFLERRDRYDGFVYRNFELDIFKSISPALSVHFERPGGSNGGDPKRLVKYKEQGFYYEFGTIEKVAKFIKEGPTKLVVEGYFQSPRYFSSENAIRQLFQFSDSVCSSNNLDLIDLYEEIIDSDDAIMLNVRRSDFVTSKFHGCLDKSFYESAADRIRQSVGCANVYIFSDDVNWCRENLVIPRSKIIDHTFKGPAFSYYLQLMIACKHFIIPNSSFAWWAAFLSDFKKKRVLYPERWFLDTSINTTSLFPSDWSSH